MMFHKGNGKVESNNRLKAEFIKNKIALKSISIKFRSNDDEKTPGSKDEEKSSRNETAASRNPGSRPKSYKSKQEQDRYNNVLSRLKQTGANITDTWTSRLHTSSRDNKPCSVLHFDPESGKTTIAEPTYSVEQQYSSYSVSKPMEAIDSTRKRIENCSAQVKTRSKEEANALKKNAVDGIENSLRVLKDAGKFCKEKSSDISKAVVKENSHKNRCDEKRKNLVKGISSDGNSNNSVDDSMEKVLSDVGLALFSPLDSIFFKKNCKEGNNKVKNDITQTIDKCSPSTTDVGNEATDNPKFFKKVHNTITDQVTVVDHVGTNKHCVNDMFSVSILPESLSIMEDSPHLLSESAMEYLNNFGFPVCIKMRQWNRIYCLRRDGDCFQTMQRCVQNYMYTLLVVKTYQGSVFGGFADRRWNIKACVGNRFYGSGEAFLFRVKKKEHKDTSNVLPKSQGCLNTDAIIAPKVGDDNESVLIYKWTGDNNFCQMFDADQGIVAMGGGGSDGSFGLCLEDSFFRGTTGKCATFGNEPLADEKEFKILDFEVFGFGA
mmetsp:Transcript_28285/g.32529  ORF Transcript_28285/g.32529 Transcript_28285/m.32529 type:complete len:548 (-) Transcript_28285:128-1771(-)